MASTDRLSESPGCAVGIGAGLWYVFPPKMIMPAKKATISIPIAVFLFMVYFLSVDELPDIAVG